MSFWGLYGGLEDKLKGSKDTNASTNSTPTAGFTSSSVLDGEPATKKRKLDVPSGLVPRSAVKKPVVSAMPAPRNAILAQKGVKPVVAATKDVVHVTNSIPLVSYGDPSEAENSQNIVSALSEFKNIYDPLKPNDFQEYLRNRDRLAEVQRQEDFKAMVAKTTSTFAPPPSLANNPSPPPPQFAPPSFPSPSPPVAPPMASPAPPASTSFLKPPPRPVAKMTETKETAPSSGEFSKPTLMNLQQLKQAQASVKSQLDTLKFSKPDEQKPNFPPPSFGESTSNNNHLYNPDSDQMFTSGGGLGLGSGSGGGGGGNVDDDDIDGVPISLDQLENLDKMDVDKEEAPAAPAPTAMAPPPPGVGAKKKKMSIAEQMMLKMGWKGAGHGLGKNQQGIAEPIIMQATGVAGQGIIIGPRLSSHQPLVTMPETRVVLLTNMVGPGEVDDSLLAETAEECQRFGRVVECEVRETRNVAPEYAVQIFIKFSHKDEAFKALADLDGRIFGGRTVRADPFDEAKFDRRDFDNGGILTG